MTAPPITQAQEKELKSLYYDKLNYFGRDKLFQLLRAKGSDISRRQVMDWLNDQEISQLYRQTRKTKSIKSTVLKAPYVQVGVDLMDLQTDAADGYQYILSAIDLFSKRGWAVPLKNKEAKTVVVGMRKILSEMKEKPQSIRSDNGSEFIAKEFKALLTETGIKQVLSSTYLPQSNGQVERFNGILKRLIRMYQTQTDKKDWPSKLPEMINNYNNTVQRTVGSTPIEAERKSFKDTHELIAKQAKKYAHLERKPLAVGDQVRLKLEADDRTKWSRKLYKVVKVFKDKTGYSKQSYAIEELDGKKIKTRYYGNDLLKVTAIQNPVEEPERWEITRLVEPKIQDGIKGYVVAWKGYRGQDTFEPRTQLVKDVPKMIKAYEKTHKVKWKNKTVEFAEGEE